MSTFISPLSVLGARDTTETFHHQRKKAQRQAAKLKKLLKIHTGDTRNYKAKQKVSKITAEDVARDPNYANVLFWTAERYSLHASEIRSERAYGPQSRAHITAKLKAAHRTLAHLVSLSTSFSAEQRIDLLTYTAIAHGALLVHQKRYAQAVASLALARVSLQRMLAQPTGEEYLYKTALEEHVDPYLKLAVASKRDARDLNTVARAHFDDRSAVLLDLLEAQQPGFAAGLKLEAGQEEIVEVRWRKYVAELYSPEIARLIQAATAASLRRQAETAESFDPATAAWSEVLDSHLSQRDQFEENDQTFEILKAYFTFQVLSTRVFRDHAVACALKLQAAAATSATATVAVHRNLVSVYNNIIATVKEVLELAGVYNDDELEATFQSVLAFITAEKLHLLACLHFEAQAFASALLLALEGVRLLAAHSVFAVDLWAPLTTAGPSQALKTRLEALTASSHVLAALALTQKVSDPNALIVDNLSKYPSGVTAKEILGRVSVGPVNAKTLLLPVPVPLVTFDLAGAYIGGGETKKSGFRWGRGSSVV